MEFILMNYLSSSLASNFLNIDTSETSEAPFIKRAFELYDTGEFTTHTLGKALFKEGWRNGSNKPLGKSQIHLILKDCFYCGEFMWNKRHYDNANHEALISKELFYRVQDRILKKVVGKTKKKDYLFNNLIKCGECSRSVCGEIHKGTHYYRCTRFQTECTQKGYAREDKIEEQVLGALEKLHIKNQRLADWLQKALKESHADEVDYHTTVVRELNHSHARTMQKLDTLYDEKIDKNITQEFYDRKFKQYSEELTEIDKAIVKHTNASISYIELGASILDLTQRAREIYTKATPEKKRKLLSVVFAELKLKDKAITPVYNKAFEFIAQRVNTINEAEDDMDVTLELEKLNTKAVILESDKKSEDLLGYKDSNLDTQDQNLMSYH
jgi:site-specific DNA recombinase